MSDEPFLIAHKVRGEAAFDIAIQQECVICVGHGGGCDECDGLGHWWICSTSGHRAYPYWHHVLQYEEREAGNFIYFDDDPAVISWWQVPDMPDNCPDHYRVNASPRAKVAEAGRSLLAKLGLAKPTQPIRRRI